MPPPTTFFFLKTEEFVYVSYADLGKIFVSLWLLLEQIHVRFMNHIGPELQRIPSYPCTKLPMIHPKAPSYHDHGNTMRLGLQMRKPKVFKRLQCFPLF